MSFQKELENRIDTSLSIFPENIASNFSKKRMFGGIAYLFHGKMTVGIIKGSLMVRIISEKIDAFLQLDHVKPMDFTKKPMKEFVYVLPEGFKTEEELQNWIELGLEHAQNKLKSL
ncbi:TfoX/Sxy family protein [uncultured Maribacter sp.]|uniref:TfoX/Sxy family protein n=1 Tax=uncultured Maribacter sp. TaxID=431308 RepID=UPI0026098C1E|nr:TfoX/Sxy family protein [uncultured Maribacter sp.]